jgi:hypothetical protein
MQYNKRILHFVLFLSLTSTDAFTSLSKSRNGGSLNQVGSRFMGRGIRLQQSAAVKTKETRKGTELGMFLGTDGGVLGVGAPEVVSVTFDFKDFYKCTLVSVLIGNFHQRQQYC